MPVFPPYSAYKDSGLDWLKDIPDHWNTTRLGSVFKERRLKVSDKEYPPLSVTKNGILPQLENAAKSNDGDNRKGVLSGDFVINSRSDRKGSSGVAKQDGSVSLINIVLDPVGINSQYCEYLLKSYEFKEEYYRYGRGIVDDLWTTRFSEMKGMMLPLPPLSEQRAIAAFLDQQIAEIQRFIALKQETIRLLQERKTALINQAVTRGLNPEVELKDSGIEWLGKVPKHWEVKKLKYLAKINSGLAKGSNLGANNLKTLPYLRVANVQDGYLNLDDIATIQINQKKAKRYFLKRGDLLMNEGGDYDKLGRGYVWNNEIDPCLHQNHVFAVRMNAGVNPYWINAVTLTQYARQYFISKAKRTTNLASISSRNIKEVPILFPPTNEQVEIINHISSYSNYLDQAISQAQQEIDLMTEYQQSLISEAVTGKVDVRLLAPQK